LRNFLDRGIRNQRAFRERGIRLNDDTIRFAVLDKFLLEQFRVEFHLIYHGFDAASG
jgi:hypothetical protein